MATGYATFLKDSKNDIPADRILNLSPSNDDDEFILQSDANKHKEQHTGFLHELAKHAAACFTIDDVQDGGCQVFVNRGMCCTQHGQEEVNTLDPPQKTQDVHKQSWTTKMTTLNTPDVKKPLVAGGKWVSVKMKTVLDFVIGKVLIEDTGPAVTINKELDATKAELAEARKKFFVAQKVASQVKKESDDDTVDTEQDSSC
mmetsp:Transcript_27344/g.46470  ORF Transcript_27344/g.46470 Transcript_27344/m.46470 type:complete len:201 (-) Transcript_27344:99-701(-)